MSAKSTEALSKGVDTSTKNPTLFVPAIIPIVIQVLFLVLAYVVFPYRTPGYTILGITVGEVVVPNPYLIWGGYFIAAILGFIASCMVVDMTNDRINGRPINLSKSMKVVTGRLGTLIVAAIIAGVCYVTFVLIPVALFIIAIAMIEGTDAIESTKRAFNFVVKNIGDVIVFIIIVIVIDIVFGIAFAFIPVVGAYIGAIVSWIVGVIFTVSTVYFYLSLRDKTAMVPPPSPPLPPQ